MTTLTTFWRASVSDRIQLNLPTIGQIEVSNPRGRFDRTSGLDGAKYLITPTSGIAEAQFLQVLYRQNNTVRFKSGHECHVS